MDTMPFATPDFTARSRLRRRLLRSIIGGSMAAGHFSVLMSSAIAKGELANVSGINQAVGLVTVNGRPAKVGTPVAVGDRVVTGKTSQAVVVLNKDAYLLRENSQLELTGKGSLLDQLLLASGQMLAVFGKGPERAIKVRNATIGIRGTGAYVEAHDKRAYLCLCYGEAAVDLARGVQLALKTNYHERPIWLYEDRYERAPFMNHKDSELEMMEALFEREPPFKGQDYPPKYD
jgi:FecR protein